MDGSQGVTLPNFTTGDPVEVGSRVRLEDGRLVRVRALIVTEDGFLVSARRLEADDRTLFRVGEIVESPDEDSAEALDEDSTLSVADYIKKRALDADGMSSQEKISLMIDDIRRRERKLSRA